MNNYKYYINSVEVFPINDSSLKYKFEKKIKSGIIFDKTLDEALQFNYISGAFNFQTQETNDRCAELTLEVHKKCGSVYALYYEAIFSVSEGEFDNDKCVFKVKTRPKRSLQEDLDVNILDTPDPVFEGGLNGIVTGLGPYDRNYQQARYFDKAILFIAQKSNPSIVGVISNFFQINPTGPWYIPGVTNYYNKMVFCNLSDIQEPIPSNLSTRCMVKFKDVMDDLNTMFDVFWYIDTNYNLRIEHRIFFDGVPGLDLTLPKYTKYLVASDKYSYDLEDYPKEEVWKILDHQEYVRLTYSGMSNVGKQRGSVTYATTLIRTDFNYIRFQGGSNNTEGLFLFATDGGIVSTYWRMLEGNNQNFKLTPELLVRSFHTNNRPSLYALFNSIHKYAGFSKSGGIVLDSVRPTKKQNKISFPLCCDDVFDPKDTILTPIGVGYVDSAEFNIKTNMLTTQLKYKVDNCSNFLPTDLTGLQLWLRHGVGVTVTGGLVSQWLDSSGNGRHATSASGPIYTGPNCPLFFSLTESLTTPAFQLTPAKRGTIIFLLNADCFSGESYGNHSVLSTHDGGAGVNFDVTISSGISNAFVSNSELQIYPRNNNALHPWADGLFIINRYQDTKVKTITDALYSTNNPCTFSNTQPASKPLIIGNNPNNIATTGQFGLYEVIIYDRSLSDFEMEQIQFYFAKQGIFTITPA